MDYHDGKYGINTSSSRGADTFIPFRSGTNYYVFFNLNRTTTPKSYTFTKRPDSVYILLGGSGGGGVSVSNLSQITYQWQMAGEGYWNGGFATAIPTDDTITFTPRGGNKAFALMLW